MKKLCLAFFILENLLPLAQATSFYLRPFSEFTQDARHIVRGTLRNIRVDKITTLEGETAIYTYADAEIREVLKGEISVPLILVRKAGGTKDGITLEVPSSPEFTENEDTVLFLSTQREDLAYEVMGLELGKFGLKQENGKEILTGGLLSYSNTHGDNHTVASGDLSENAKPWTLAALRGLIKKQDKAPHVIPPPKQSKNVNDMAPFSDFQHEAEKLEKKEKLENAPLSDGLSNTSLFYFILSGVLMLSAIFLYLRRR